MNGNFQLVLKNVNDKKADNKMLAFFFMIQKKNNENKNQGSVLFFSGEK